MEGEREYQRKSTFFGVRLRVCLIRSSIFWSVCMRTAIIFHKSAPLLRYQTTQALCRTLLYYHFASQCMCDPRRSACAIRCSF